MLFILYPWIAFDVTGSSAAAGLLITLTAIPGLLLSPVMGSIIDRFGRRNTSMWVEYASAASVIALPIVAWFIDINLFLLILINTLKNFVSSGSPSARKSLVPDAADAAGMSLPRANSIHEALFATGFAIGPAIAAVLISQIGAINAMWVSGIFSLLSAIFSWLIRVHERHEEGDEESGNIFVYASQGFRILFATPAVLIMMSTFLFLAIVYLPTEMVVLPRHFNEIGNPEGLGTIISVMAASSTVGALLFERINKYLSFAKIFRIAILGVALSMIPMALLPPQWAFILFGAILGLTWGPLGPLLNTVVQEKIPANKRGRVFALELAIWSGGPMISMVGVGLALDAWGVQAVYLAEAILVTAIAIFMATRKHLRELDK
ncbi:MAG: hypothetical protein RIS82_793 [Actinomycetota bacterium]